MSAANHILTGNTFTGGYALLCTHCGEVYVPSLRELAGVAEMES